MAAACYRHVSRLGAAILLLAGFLATNASARANEAEVRLAEPFRSEYAGRHATGEHVIALWKFNQPEPAADASGHGHELTFRGAEFAEGGRFGGALRSFRGWPEVDEPH